MTLRRLSVKPISMQRYLTAAFCILFTSSAFAEFPTEHPWPQVTYHLEKQLQPLEEIHTVAFRLDTFSNS